MVQYYAEYHHVVQCSSVRHSPAAAAMVVVVVMAVVWSGIEWHEITR
jgi:hypothetical protein